MPSVVQALASMLSAGADASSRVTAAGLGANAHMAAANAGLQGDMYRTNSTNQLGNRNLDSNNQQFQAEQFLRSAMAGQNFGLQNRQLEQQGQYQQGQLGIQRDQLGLQREQLGVDRDARLADINLRLADLGQGPYASRMPNFDDLLGGQQPGGSGQPATTPRYEGAGDWLQQLLGFGKQQQQPQSGGASMEIAKRMIATRNPRLMQQGFTMLQHAESQAQSQREFDFKKQTATDPRAFLPFIEGVTPDNYDRVLDMLERRRAGGSLIQSGQSPSVPWSQQDGVESKFKTDPVLDALDIPGRPAEAIGQSILGKEKSGVLDDPAAVARIAEYLRYRRQKDPNFGRPLEWGGKTLIDESSALIEAIINGVDPRVVLKQRRDQINKGPSGDLEWMMGGGGI